MGGGSDPCRPQGVSQSICLGSRWSDGKASMQTVSRMASMGTRGCCGGLFVGFFCLTCGPVFRYSTGQKALSYSFMSTWGRSHDALDVHRVRVLSPE